MLWQLTERRKSDKLIIELAKTNSMLKENNIDKLLTKVYDGLGPWVGEL